MNLKRRGFEVRASEFSVDTFSLPIQMEMSKRQWIFKANVHWG